MGFCREQDKFTKMGFRHKTLQCTGNLGLTWWFCCWVVNSSCRIAETRTSPWTFSWSLQRLRCLVRTDKPCWGVQFCSDTGETLWLSGEMDSGAVVCHHPNYLNSEEKSWFCMGGLRKCLHRWNLSWRRNLKCSTRQSRDIERRVKVSRGMNTLSHQRVRGQTPIRSGVLGEDMNKEWTRSLTRASWLVIVH